MGVVVMGFVGFFSFPIVVASSGMQVVGYL